MKKILFVSLMIFSLSALAIPGVGQEGGSSGFSVGNPDSCVGCSLRSAKKNVGERRSGKQTRDTAGLGVTPKGVIRK